MIKGITINGNTKILLKNWINSYINKERFSSREFNFDRYRCLTIDADLNGKLVIKFNIRTAYNDLTPLYTIASFTIDEIDKGIEEIISWINEKQ